jgi:HEAT repeat protein
MSDSIDLLISKLVHRLRDADPIVRRNAAGALRLHGERATTALEDLAQLVNDDDPRVRAEAERALSGLRESAA